MRLRPRARAAHAGKRWGAGAVVTLLLCAPQMRPNEQPNSQKLKLAARKTLETHAAEAWTPSAAAAARYSATGIARRDQFSSG